MYSFHIHPVINTWIKCYIWEDLEAMREYTKRYEGGEYGNRSGYFYAPSYRFNSDMRLINRKLGEIHLVDGHFGAGVVAHEIQHFVSTYQRNMNWDVIGDEWEIVAYLCGDLNREFWEEYYKRNKAEE